MNNFERNLKQLLDTDVDPSMFPVVKDKSIYIGKYKIHCNEKFTVRYENNIFSLGQMYTKYAALALVKSYIKQKYSRSRIFDLDRRLYHNFNNAKFYKNVIDKSQDSFQVETSSIRLEVANKEIAYARSMLRKMLRC